MSHDRGCWKCGREKWEYRECRDPMCGKRLECGCYATCKCGKEEQVHTWVRARALAEHDKDVARFLKYVDVLPNGCWYWTGARSRGKGNRKWYGSFRYKGKVIRAHVFSSSVLAGQKCPPGHHRDHTCVFSMCVCPAHIEITTHAENENRKKARKR